MSAKIRVREPDKKKRRKIRSLVRKHKLDRRRLYVVGYEGCLSADAKFTRPCSGCSCDCSEGGCSHGNGGCEECGFTGKRVEHFPDPIQIEGRFVQVEPCYCSGCGGEMEHFDAGCEKCAAAFKEGGDAK